ncbi:MAG: hypothetical protein M3Z28_04535 [Candidatus Dormibacteraeota bacterium]|nr:hypothetical protein [Candidatus Dormibacteraeota bacterium]
MPVGGEDDLVSHVSRARRADETTGADTNALQLVNGLADRGRDLARLVHIPGEAADVVTLAHGQHQHLRMRPARDSRRGANQLARLGGWLHRQQHPVRAGINYVATHALTL